MADCRRSGLVRFRRTALEGLGASPVSAVRPLYPTRKKLARRFAGVLSFLCFALLLTWEPVSAAPPSPAAYERLAAALEVYRGLEGRGGWAPIPPGPDLSVGDRDPRVALLRNRLRITGDYGDSMGSADAWFFDSALQEALRYFQRRHGIWTDGTLGEPTREVLNVPARERVRQIEIAMQRVQVLPTDRGERYVWINIPAATIELVENGRTSIAMRAIVGHPSRPTPTMTSKITGVVFNPPWVVPTTIAVEDILPRQQGDPDYLQRTRIRVFDGWRADADELDPAEVDWRALGPGRFPYRLQQDPGPWNSLGRVKVIFDNDQDIFVHDTNTKALFDLPMRSFSSGCVRLENAIPFVETLLNRESGWDISDMPGPEEPRTLPVSLSEPVPIYLVYLTVWATPDGTVNFRRDVYGLDHLELAAGAIER